jgi:hypothetical protein
MVFLFTVAAASGFFPTAVNFVHGGPGPTLGFLLGDTAALVTLLNVLLLPFLFVSVFGFVSAWHFILHDERRTNLAEAIPSRVIRDEW